MWTVLYRTRSSRTQFGVSINVWRLAGNTLNISCNFLYCNHRVHRDFSITLYFIYLYENHIFLQWLLDSLFDLMCFLSQMDEQQRVDVPDPIQQLHDRMQRLQQQEQEQEQEKQQLLSAVLQQLIQKRRDLQRVTEDVLRLERLLQVLAPGNEKHPSL